MFKKTKLEISDVDETANKAACLLDALIEDTFPDQPKHIDLSKCYKLLERARQLKVHATRYYGEHGYTPYDNVLKVLMATLSGMIDDFERDRKLDALLDVAAGGRIQSRGFYKEPPQPT